jgi:nucleoside-diphosphate-sugar epimerase
MKVAITGAAGFIGTHVALDWLTAGAQVRALRRRATAVPEVLASRVEWVEGDLAQSEIPPGFPGDVDLCIHLAALYAEGEQHWAALKATNGTGTSRVLEACDRDRVGRFVYVGTMGTRTPPPGGGIATEGDQVDPAKASAYARSKALGESLALAWTGGEVVVALPAAPIGAFDVRPSVTGARVLDTLCGRYPRLLQGPVNYVAAPGLAVGIRLVALSGRAGRAYLLGGENLGPQAFLARLCEAANVPPPSRTLMDRLRGRRLPEPGSLAIDDSRAREELGYRPGDLDQALRDAAQDFRRRGLSP